MVEYTITLKIRRDSCALQRLCIAVAINGTGKGLYFCGILPRKTSLGGAEGGTCSATSSLAARTRAKRNLHGVGGRRRLVRRRAAAERVCVIGVAEASSDAAALGLQLAGGITHQARIVGGGNAIRTKERAQES